MESTTFQLKKYRVNAKEKPKKDIAFTLDSSRPDQTGAHIMLYHITKPT